MTAAPLAPPRTGDVADRFRCAVDIPDPPADAAGRKQYWEDTVAEAVADLRRRLASGHDEKSFQALAMIVDLEKTRLRHKEPVAGTQVESRFDSGLRPVEQCEPAVAKYQGPPEPSEVVPPPPAAPTPPPVAAPPAEPPPPRLRHPHHPATAAINTMTDEEHAEYQRWSWERRYGYPPLSGLPSTWSAPA